MIAGGPAPRRRRRADRPARSGTARRSFAACLPPGATIPFGPLWFLGVYLVVVRIAPWMIALHRRFRLVGAGGHGLGAIAADVIGFRRASAGAVVQRRVRAAAPAPAGVLLRATGRAGPRRRRSGRMVAAGLGGLVLLTNPPLLEAVRRRPVRLVPRDRRLPEEPARHRRRAGLERLSADRVLPARWDLVDRRGHAARPWLQRWLQRPASLEVHDRRERRDHDAVPLAHDRVPAARCCCCGRWGSAIRPTAPRDGGWSGSCGRWCRRSSWPDWWPCSDGSSGRTRRGSRLEARSVA